MKVCCYQVSHKHIDPSQNPEELHARLEQRSKKKRQKDLNHIVARCAEVRLLLMEKNYRNERGFLKLCQEWSFLDSFIADLDKGEKYPHQLATARLFPSAVRHLSREQNTLLQEVYDLYFDSRSCRALHLFNFENARWVAENLGIFKEEPEMVSALWNPSDDNAITAKAVAARRLASNFGFMARYLVGHRGHSQGDVAIAIDEFQRVMSTESPSLPTGGGFVNTGVSCYLNSTLQLLRRIPNIESHLEILCRRQGHPLALNLRRVLQRVNAGKVCESSLMKGFFDRCWKAGWSEVAESRGDQQDAAEFFRWLYEALGLAHNPVRMLQVCHWNDRDSEAVVDKLELPCEIPLGARVSAQELLEASLSHAASDSEAKLEMKITNPPPAYFLQTLKRFRPTARGGLQKVRTQVDFSQGLSLQVEGETCRYRAVSITRHSGGALAGGHYMNDSLHPDGSWNTYNDQRPPVGSSGPFSDTVQGEVSQILWVRDPLA